LRIRPTPNPSREREGLEAERGYAAGHSELPDDRMLSHPAGRGWVPLSRDLGIPSEHESTRALRQVVTVEHCFPDGTPDDPVAAVGCSAVFTTERRVRFLDHLAFKGNVRAAAALVAVSHETVYRKRRQDAGFAALWDAALVHARTYNESVLASRALDGVEAPVYYHGEIAGYRIVHDPRLLLAHIARLDRHVEARPEAVALADRFDELLAAHAGHAPPADFVEAAEELRGAGEAGGEGAGADVLALPPTREEYALHHRGRALDALAGSEEEGAEPAPAELDALEAGESAAMAGAGEAAGAAWDSWREGALALIGRIVRRARGEEEASEDAWGGEDEGDTSPPSSSPRTRGPSENDGPATPSAPAPASAGTGSCAGVTNEAEADPEPDPDAVPTDLPYEIKSAPARVAPHSAALNRVTGVNPLPPRAGEGDHAQHGGGDSPQAPSRRRVPSVTGPRPAPPPPCRGGSPRPDKQRAGKGVPTDRRSARPNGRPDPGLDPGEESQGPRMGPARRLRRKQKSAFPVALDEFLGGLEIEPVLLAGEPDRLDLAALGDRVADRRVAEHVRVAVARGGG
jgi:hypothetical protein